MSVIKMCDSCKKTEDKLDVDVLTTIKIKDDFYTNENLKFHLCNDCLKKMMNHVFGLAWDPPSQEWQETKYKEESL